MRIMADENMLESVVTRLQDDGHDVIWANQVSPGDRDTNQLALATREVRTLITYDKDYGDLIRRDGEPAPYGVLLFRIHNDVPVESEIDFVVGTVKVRDQWPPGLWTIQIRHSN